MKRRLRLWKFKETESKVIVRDKRTICVSVPSVDNKELFALHEFNPPGNNRKRG